MQLMFQDPYASLDPRMRVGTILSEPSSSRGSATPPNDEKVRALLNEVGLNPKSADLYPHEFSGGQRQRIGLEPPLRPFWTRHLAACHFPLQTPTGATPVDQVPAAIG